MQRCVVLLAAAATCIALAAGGPTSRPTSRSATTTPAGPPPVPVKRIDLLVGLLASDVYNVRRDAREELLKIVPAPGVAEVIKAHLKRATDAETRVSLEHVLEGHDLPLVMIWYVGGLSSMPGSASHPWLYIRADGTFFIDRTSLLFTGRRPAAPVGQCRQGRLNYPELLALQRMIDASGLARLTDQIAPRHKVGAVQMVCYLRSGRHRRIRRSSWPPDAFDPDKTPSTRPATAADVSLALALRNYLAGRSSRPYDGPVALHVMYGARAGGGRLGRAEIATLPEWEIPSVDLMDKSARMGGIVLDEAELKAVRAAMAKTRVYKLSAYAAGEVYLAPHLEDAVEVQFGPG